MNALKTYLCTSSSQIEGTPSTKAQMTYIAGIDYSCETEANAACHCCSSLHAQSSGIRDT